MAMTQMRAFAPGARTVIRDEEWLIRRADPSTDGGWLLTCDGTTVTQWITDDTLPGGPRTVEWHYVAPFARASREDD